jgi:hypothetical protein
MTAIVETQIGNEIVYMWLSLEDARGGQRMSKRRPLKSDGMSEWIQKQKKKTPSVWPEGAYAVTTYGQSDGERVASGVE